MLDFRSDTITKPTPAMRQAMLQAEVGDDVWEEDPTVNRLEKKVAELFERQACIMERRTHSFSHEVGGGSALLGVIFNVLDSHDGMITPEQVKPAIRHKDVHEPISKLIVVENSVNLAGGRVVPLQNIQAMRELADEYEMRLHMDGARVFNAAVASGTKVADYAKAVDTLSFCLSKGLGCPVGSVVIGDQVVIQRARWYRKMLGGGMRQVGILAACGIYALDNNIARLADDHLLAKQLADSLSECLDDRHTVQEPETNILLIHTDGPTTTTTTLENWKTQGILALPLADKTIRLVTHLDLPKDAASQVAQRLKELRA
ncbi:MAG: threonine aldolase [Deltaproteobacteria bacterium]|nr:threonine aldolase [Deltaproteobacteria bacterium]